MTCAIERPRCQLARIQTVPDRMFWFLIIATVATMKRLFYVSRFSRPLAKHDIDAIRESAIRYNRLHRVTGILVCLGDMFFQALEGEEAIVDELYNDRIRPDNRH